MVPELLSIRTDWVTFIAIYNGHLIFVVGHAILYVAEEKGADRVSRSFCMKKLKASLL